MRLTMIASLSKAKGLLLVLVLLCSNIILADGQRSKLSTSVKSEKAKGNLVERNAVLSTNNTSAISGDSADKNKVADNENDVLATKPVAINPSQATNKKEQDDVKVAEEQVVANRTKNFKDVLVAATDDLKDGDAEKVPTKRDLPFLIQSSPGVPTLSENLLRGFTPIQEPFDEQSFDRDHRQQLLQRSDTEYNSNMPQVFISNPPLQQQQQTQQQPIAFSSPHTSHYQQQQNDVHQQQPQQQHSFNPYAQYQTNQAYHHQSPVSAASTSHFSFQTPYSHHESAPTALKLNYNPYSSSPHISIITAAPSNKFATLAQLQSPYLNYASAASQPAGAFATSYPTVTSSYGFPASGQFVGYATTVQPQYQYQASTNGQAQQQQQQQQLANAYSNSLLLGRIPHNQPITDYSYHNPNIIHAHNQNLHASSFAKVSNPSSVFNHANGQSLYQLSPYAYPVQAAFQVGSSVAPGTANVKPYPVHHFQQQGIPSASSLALTGSSPTLATPQYKHYAGAALSAAGALANSYNINKNEVSNHLGYNANGPTIATIKVNPYAPQSFNQLSNGSPQYQAAGIAFSYAKPISSFGQYQQPQQSTLHANTYPYTSTAYQQGPQLLTPAAAASSNQQTAYYVNAQSYYGSPNKYQSAYAQIGGTPHKVLYASH